MKKSMSDDETYGVMQHLKYKRTDWYVSHSEKDGFVLHLTAISRFRESIDTVAANLCEVTGHRWCHRYSSVVDWSWKSQVTMATIPIDRETADKLSWQRGGWDHLDVDDDE